MTKEQKKFVTRYTKPYIPRYGVYVLLVVLMSFFSICSILSINNFLQILFADNASNIVAKTELDELLNKIYSFFLVYGKQNALIYFTFIILLVYFLKDLFEWLSAYYMGCTRNRITRHIRGRLFDRFISQDLSFYVKHKKGDLLSRISTDVIEYDEMVLKSIQTIINSLVVVLMYLLILFYIEWKLTIVTILLFPLVALLTSVVSRKLKQYSKKLQATNGFIVSLIEQTVGGLRVIKSLTAIEHVNKYFGKVNKDFTVLRNKVYRMIDLASPFSEVVSGVVVGVLLLVGSNSVLNEHTITSTMFIVYLILFILIIKPAKDASTAFYNMKKGSACMDRIIEIESSVNTIEEPSTPLDFPKLSRAIEFKDVCFSYVKGQEVLHHVSCVFEKGKTTAIVGASGGGKTTIIDLIEKFYEPDSGKILFDDVSSSDLHSRDIRDNISIVGQDTVLVNDTVANNICFGDKGYTIEQIKEAARIANAEEFIVCLPEGYNTNIGDKGDRLSGGQKQRIAIARAVLRNSPILILDEATSALDNKSESLVQQALDNVSKGRTLISIAHRLSTIQNADKIIVLDNGRIVEQGTHEQLTALHGLYFNLSMMQKL